MRVPGMLHGRVVRPRGQGAYGDGINPVPLAVDAKSIKKLPDVQIVHVGNFLGVVAPKECDAIQAAAQLKVAWSDPPKIDLVGNHLVGHASVRLRGPGPGAHRGAGPDDAGSPGQLSSVDAAMASAATIPTG